MTRRVTRRRKPSPLQRIDREGLTATARRYRTRDLAAGGSVCTGRAGSRPGHAAASPGPAVRYSGGRFSFTQRCTDGRSHCARA